MSRKAATAIVLPSGTEAKLDGLMFSVKGPKGSLTQKLMTGIDVKIEGNEISVQIAKGSIIGKNFLGLYWSLIFNMVKGVSTGYVRELEMIGVGFRAAVQGNLLDLQLGYSHPVKVKIPEGIQVKVERNTNIQLEGIDKQKIGQFAADIRAKRPPEPYKGKGVRYKDEYVRRKAGKAGKK